MNNSLKLSLALILFCGSACARVSDKAFIDAVREGELGMVETLFPSINNYVTFDKALREAARNGDGELFNRLAPYASPRGFRKGLESLKRHNRCRKVYRNALAARQAFKRYSVDCPTTSTDTMVAPAA